VRPLRELARTADDTPDRDRYVDLLRLVTIAIVVLGHWLGAVVVEDAQHRPTTGSASGLLPWTAPLTWLFQLVPMFFLVTGRTNAALLVSDRRHGRDVASWLRARGARLVPTATTALLAFSAGAVAARLAGADPVVVRAAVRTATMPLWFFTIYLVLVLLTPVMYRLHVRFGVSVMVVLVLLVGIGDGARFAGVHGARFAGVDALAAGNFLFGWLAVHQAGFFWYDGSLRWGRRASLALLAGGLTVLVLLTVAGPYPVVMVDVVGQRIKNASPPSLALLALTAAHLGLFLLLRERAGQWLRGRRRWRLVVLVNAVALTVFLWHMSVVPLLAYPLWTVHALPVARVGSWSWWAWRVPWLLLLTLALAVLVAVFGPVEARPREPRYPPSPWVPARLRLPLTVTGFLATVVGFLLNNTTPPAHPEPLGVPTVALATFLSGALLLRVLRSL
jgi:surface polysaccharide O-acyltransferase-like enzyme